MHSNFTIYYPTGPTNCKGNTCGWDVETSLDVEWSHAIAPGANIALVLGLNNDDSNLDLAVLYAIDNLLGNVISNSYGEPEASLVTGDPAELTVKNNINETGAALGISVNYSSGDDGDYLAAYGATTVSMPASSPYATAVGGTSLFLNKDQSIKVQTGWGTNLTRIADTATSGDTGQPPLIPPDFFGFYFGAGGGASSVWPLPPYQESLGGGWRHVPDIAMVADPYTGVEVIDTEGGSSSSASSAEPALPVPPSPQSGRSPTRQPASSWARLRRLFTVCLPVPSPTSSPSTGLTTCMASRTSRTQPMSTTPRRSCWRRCKAAPTLSARYTTAPRPAGTRSASAPTVR